MRNIKKKIKEKKLQLSETYRVVSRQLETEEHFKLNAMIEKLRAKGRDASALIEKLNAITKINRVEVVCNKVPTVGLAAIISHLTSISPSPTTLKINKCALGSGNTAPAAGDTTLATEVYRNNIASLTSADNIGYGTGFFSATEVNGTFAEVGLFIEGAAGADTGTLFSRALLAVVKSATETLTIDYTITLTSVN